MPTRISASTSADHVRPDGHRVGRHDAPVRAVGPGEPAQVDRRRYRKRSRLRASCRPLPQSKSYVNALQWAIGLEIFLLVKDPWRVVLTTDHPNGGPHELPASDPPADGTGLSAKSSLPSAPRGGGQRGVALDHARAVLERDRDDDPRGAGAAARPARPRAPGRGAAADIVLYRDAADREAMFTSPDCVFKDGTLVARAGAHHRGAGGRHAHHRARFTTAASRGRLRSTTPATARLNFDHVAIGRDELCRCCNGGACCRPPVS